MGPASNSTSSFSPYSSNLGLSSVRETNVLSMDETNPSKGAVVGIAEPDLYDPDQPLWNKEQPADDKLRKPPFRKGMEDAERENVISADEGTSTGSQGPPSVWNRIGRVDRGDVNSESITRSNPSIQRLRFPRREILEVHEPQIISGKSESVYDEQDEKTALMLDVSTIPEGEGEQRPSEKLGFNPRGRWNKEPGNERAQRTLYIGGIPSNINKKTTKTNKQVRKQNPLNR